MTRHLLQLNLGPVQEFIAQARRSRDLWHGSHLLSEISRRAARLVAEAGGYLIFPALAKGDPELEPCAGPLRPDGHPNAGKAPLNVANIILAEADGDHESLAAFARDVRDEVQKFWAELAAKVRGKCRGLIAQAPGIGPAWDEQIETFLEFSAAWTPLGQDYAGARQRLVDAVAARKNLRDFEPWRAQRSEGGIAVPKSSLDGARETVLAEPEHRAKGLIREYRIEPGEQLDAVGVIKRAGGEPEQFVPIVNVALAAWLHEARKAAPSEFGALRRVCGSDKTSSDAVDLARIERGDLAWTRVFKYDASIFLENRLWPTFEERGLLANADPEQFGRPQTTEWKTRVKEWGDRYVTPVLKRTAKPFPYVACLVADGDGMGKAIDGISRGEDAADRHRRFSKRLAEFAAIARHIVEQEHLGSLVYSGGDDVLAFLPLPTALKCAQSLRHAFEELMKEACPGFKSDELPTLSVGLGIGHVLESMGDLLNLGRDAEKLAKGGHLPSVRRRNALAVIVDKRSGGRRQWRARWNDAQFVKGSAGRLMDDAELLCGTVSTRKVYQIADTLRRFPRPGDSIDDPAVWADMLATEVRRSLERMDAGAASFRLDDATLKGQLGLDLSRASGPDETLYQVRHGTVADWIDRLLIAKAFDEAEPMPRKPGKVATHAGSSGSEGGAATAGRVQ